MMDADEKGSYDGGAPTGGRAGARLPGAGTWTRYSTRDGCRDTGPFLAGSWGWHLLALALIAAMMLSGCQRTASKQAQASPEVIVEQAQISSSGQMLQTTGIVNPWQEAKISFQVSGQIASGPLDEGTPVAAGTTLARLDASDYRSRGAVSGLGRRKGANVQPPAVF